MMHFFSVFLIAAMKFEVYEGALLVYLWQLLTFSCQASYILQTVTDVIGAGNYSYYKLKKQGSVRLSLTSLEGDADLYVASEVSQPDYENYDLKSATCGLDIVDVAEDVVRPVGIGVYGHSSADISKFILDITVLEDQSVDGSSHPNKASASGRYSGPNSKHEEDESIVSTILVGILKIVLDILL